MLYCPRLFSQPSVQEKDVSTQRLVKVTVKDALLDREGLSGTYIRQNDGSWIRTNDGLQCSSGSRLGVILRQAYSRTVREMYEVQPANAYKPRPLTF
jgi:hypothetical protein